MREGGGWWREVREEGKGIEGGERGWKEVGGGEMGVVG